MGLKARVKTGHYPTPISVVETIEGFLIRKTRFGRVASKWYARELTKVLKEKFEFKIKEAGESYGRYIKFSDRKVLGQIEKKF